MCDIRKAPLREKPGSKLSNVKKVTFFPGASHLIGGRSTNYEYQYPGPFIVNRIS